MGRNKSNVKGITLIALVVTIVVLLILASVSISVLTGENGIIQQAKKAKEDTDKAEILEDLNLKIVQESVIDNEGISELKNIDIVGINKIVNTLEGSTISVDFVIKEKNQFYNVEFKEETQSFENIEKVDSLRIEAMLFYEISQEDSEVNIEWLTGMDFKYEDIIYTIYEEEQTDKYVAYVGIAEPMKIRVDSGEYGTVAIPHFEEFSAHYIEWGDGTYSKRFIKAPFYNEPREDHVYEESNKEYIISIYGDIRELTAEYIDDYRNQIIAIEDWGKGNYIESLNLAECSNLRSVAESRRETFYEVRSFYETFEKCTSLIKIPKNFFENCPKVESFTYTFWGCESLTGEAPELWKRGTNTPENDYRGNPDGWACFAGCTGLTNFDIIPDYWTVVEPL